MDVHARFAALVAEFAERPGVQAPDGVRLFGSVTLRVGGSIFAMLSGERLVVKLPRERVASMIANGDGAPFGAGKGRAMKEWMTVLDEGAWLDLSSEALKFVDSRR